MLEQDSSSQDNLQSLQNQIDNLSSEVTKLKNESSKTDMSIQGQGSTFNSDKVDGIDANTKPYPNCLVPLGPDGKFPASTVPSSGGGSGFVLTGPATDKHVIVADGTNWNSVAASGDVTVTANTGTLTLADTAVTATSYGDSTHVATFTVDSKGRLTAAANVAIASGGSFYTLDGHNTVTSGTSLTVNLGSYKHWKCLSEGTFEGTGSNGSTSFGIRFNSDSGNNYDWTHLQIGLAAGFNSPVLAGVDQISLAYTSAVRNGKTYVAAWDVSFNSTANITRVLGSITTFGSAGGGGDTISTVHFGGAYHGSDVPSSMTLVCTQNFTAQMVAAGGNFS